jgi:hypothetical protein
MVEGIASRQAGAKPKLPKATGAIKDSSEDVAGEAEVPKQAKETLHNVTPVQTRQRSERAPTRKKRKVITKTATVEASQAAHPTEKETIEKNKEEVEAKPVEAPKRVQWKPNLKMLAKCMLEQGKINQLNKYFDRYEADDQILIEDMVIEYMIKYKKNLIELEGSIPQELYDRLEVRKLRAIEEDQQIRVKTIENLLPVISNLEYATILDAIKPTLNKIKKIYIYMLSFRLRG